MNTQAFSNSSSQQMQVDRLDRIFAQARASQPDFNDDNFTKTVLNRLPANPHRLRNTRYYPDIVGLCCGLLLTYLLVDPARLVAGVLQILPENISLSLWNLLLVSATLSVLALLGWWSVEQRPEEI